MKTQHKPYGLYEKYFKRPLDLLCGVAVVIFFGWLYVIIAILAFDKALYSIFNVSNALISKDFSILARSPTLTITF